MSSCEDVMLPVADLPNYPFVLYEHCCGCQDQNLHQDVDTKRRSNWACIGNPKLEQETIEGTHAQETLLRLFVTYKPHKKRQPESR